MFDIFSVSGLRPAEAHITLIVHILLLFAYIGVFIPEIDPVFSLVFGLLYYVHGLTIFLYDIYRIYFCRARIGFFHFQSIIFIFFAIVIQYAVLYSIVWNFNSNAFTGIPNDLSGINRASALGLSVYLSTETTTGLGAATIFPNTGPGFFVNWLNTIQSWFFLVFSVTKASSLIETHQEKHRNPHAIPLPPRREWQ